MTARMASSELKYLPLASDKDISRLAMPIIRAVNGIVEMHPALPVSPRPPAVQVAPANRETRSKDQEC